jgi:hypothetical protein
MPPTKKIYASEDDPLSLAIQPPKHETDEQRTERLHAEAEAKRISDEIDEQLNRERQAAKKAPKPIKLLLLGALSHRPIVSLSYIHAMLVTQAKASQESQRLSRVSVSSYPSVCGAHSYCRGS